MGKEEITQNCTSPTGGFGRSSTFKKTNKQKKVPQRGLGVAQLEKIRLEQQQKKATSVLSSQTPPASSSLPSPTKSSPCVPPNPTPPPIRHYQPPSSVPFPSMPLLDLPSPNSIFGPSNADAVRKPNGVSTMSLPNNGCEITGQQHSHVPNFWNPNCEYNGGADLNKESSSGILDPGFAFRPSLHNLPTFDNSNPIWPLPNFQQRTQQFHHQPPSPPPPPPPPPSLVNVSSATSISSSSSVLNFHTEPPSNQSYYSNYTTPMWSEEERMVGMKRSYPFPHDNDAPSINFEFPTFAALPVRTDETNSCENRGSTFNLDPGGNIVFREGPTCSTSISESNSKISIKENGSVNGDFLTLAPPTTNRTCPSSKFNFPLGYLAFHDPEVPDFTSFPYQGSSEDTTFQPGPSGSPAQQAFYTFIPPAKAQTVRPAAIINNCIGEVGESVDLNLKL